VFEAKDNDCQSCISRSFSILLFATDLTNTKVTVSIAVLVQAFISSRLDYCSLVLYGITDKLIQRLQSV